MDRHSDTAPTVAFDLSRRTIGRFVIGVRIGGGGMGEVYRAEDTQLKRTVAIKRLSPKTTQRGGLNLLREAQRASALNHPRIAAVYDVFADGDELFLVMEYIEGMTLGERMKSPVGLRESYDIAVQCLEAIVAAHEKGILHGDLKPANIMLTFSKNEVKVCDFGVARRIVGEAGPDVRDTTLAGFAGTPAYMAPEVVCEQPVDLRADIFSLGVVFYEMLARTNPFAAESMLATFDRIRQLSPESLLRFNPLVPPALDRLVGRMIEKDPSKRYQRASDVLVDLHNMKAELDSAASVPKPASRKKALTAVAALLLVASLALTQFERPRSQQPDAIPADINLAVLPFTVIGADRDKQFFTEGLSDTLNAKLASLTVDRKLQVATASDIRARGVKNATDARQQLGANVALTASLQFAGNELRVNCMLVDAKSGHTLRTETMTVPIEDSFAVQDRIVGAMIHMIGIELKPDERQALASHGTEQPGAFDFYLQGRGYLLNFDRTENLDSAVSVFRLALEKDPRYALAYAGLGEAYWRRYEITKAVEWVELARGACEAALVIDQNSAAPHACVGMVLNGQGQNEKAASEFGLALDREPTNDGYYVGLATAFEKLGRNADAERTYRRAIDLRPRYWGAYNALAVYLSRKGRVDEALKMFQQVVALAPDSFRGYRNLGAVQFLKDQIPEAIASFEKSLSIRPNYEAASNLGTLYYFEGQYSRAADAYRQALSLNQDDFQVWGNFGATLRQANKPAESATAYKRALALAEERLRVNPKNAEVQMEVANYTAAIGDTQKAMTMVKNVIASAPTAPHTLLQLALFFEGRLRQREQALNWLAKAIANGQTWREIDRSPELTDLRKDSRFQQLRNH
jgi:serine/threonine-protein kinase